MRILTAITPFIVALAFTTSAQAVTASYCNDTLRGQASLAPDNDIYARWQALEAYYGWNITSSYAMSWSHAGSATQTYIEARWVFWRANGQVYYDWFYCNDLRPYNGSYGDAKGRL